MDGSRVRAALTLMAITTAIGILPLATTAAASVEGSCTGSATINGVRYTPDNDTPANPVVVPTGSLSITYDGSTGFDNQNHNGFIAVDLGPIAVTVRDWMDDDPDAPNSPSASGSIEVADLRDQVPFQLRGLYRATGEHHADGGDCSGFVLVKFEGAVFDSPLAVAATGGSALGLLALGLAGLVPVKRGATGKVRGRPIVGIAGGLVAGLSLALLAQQFSIAPMTSVLFYAALILGALLGLALAFVPPFGRSRATAARLSGVETAAPGTIEVADISSLEDRLDRVDLELNSLLVVQEATDLLPFSRSLLQDINKQFSELKSELQADAPSIKDLVELDPKKIDIDKLPVGAAALVNGLNTSLEALSATLGANSRKVRAALSALGEVGEGLGTASTWSDEVAKTAASFDRAFAIFEKTRDGALTNDELIEAFDIYMAQTLGALSGLVKGMPSFGVMLDQYAKAISSIVKDLKTISAATTRTNEAIAEAGKALGATKTTTVQHVDAAAEARAERIGELTRERAELVQQLDDEKWRLAEGTVRGAEKAADEAARKATGHRYETAKRIVGDAFIHSTADPSWVPPKEIAEARDLARRGWPDYMATQEVFQKTLGDYARTHWKNMNGMEQRAFLHHHPFLQGVVGDQPLKPLHATAGDSA